MNYIQNQPHRLRQNNMTKATAIRLAAISILAITVVLILAAAWVVTIGCLKLVVLIVLIQ